MRHARRPAGLRAPDGPDHPHRGGAPPGRGSRRPHRVARHRPRRPGGVGHRRHGQRARLADAAAARRLRHRAVRPPGRRAQRPGHLRARPRAAPTRRTRRPSTPGAAGGDHRGAQAVRRRLREGEPQRAALRRHGRRRPRHGPAAPGPRRQRADLHGPVLRHAARAHLRLAVPHPRPGHGARQRHRPRADLRPDDPGPGRGLREHARRRSSPGAPAAPRCPWRPAGDPTTALLALLATAATSPAPAGGGRSWPGPDELYDALLDASTPSRTGRSSARRWPPTPPATAHRSSPCPTHYNTGRLHQRRRRRHGHRLPRPPRVARPGLLRRAGRRRSRPRPRSSGPLLAWGEAGCAVWPVAADAAGGAGGRPRRAARSSSSERRTTRPRPTPGR